MLKILSNEFITLQSLKNGLRMFLVIRSLNEIKCEYFLLIQRGHFSDELKKAKCEKNFIKVTI